MTVRIAVTNEGLEVAQTDEPVGVFMGTDCPHYMPDHVNVFVGKNFTEAKQTTINWVADHLAELEGVLDDVKSLRVRHVT